MTHTVVYSPRARRHLESIYDYVADRAGPEIARRFTGRLEDACERLEAFPLRGTARDDIRPGLRVIGYKRRAAIVFAVETDTVVIHGVFYGGQDFEAAFDEDDAAQDE